MPLPESCDYLVVGGGATGMAFADTLLHAAAAAAAASSSSSPPMTLVMVDKHDRPGGQWNDSYRFVRLHQPSSMYGVETCKLEKGNDSDGAADKAAPEHHRATRAEILDYYDVVRRKLEAQYDFQFCGGVTFDFSQQPVSSHENGVLSYRLGNQHGGSMIQVRKKLVDARYLEPDLPVFIPPKFSYDPTKIRCVPVNALSEVEEEEKEEEEVSNHPHPSSPRYFVVIGAGKTDMDAIVFLLTQRHVDPDRILWVVPHEAWITAREKITSCLEFLHTCTQLAKQKQQLEQSGHDPASLKKALTSKDFFQNGFLQWEAEGKVYRFDKGVLPTKFKDATLSKEELALLQKVTKVLRHGRIQRIQDNGDLVSANGSTVPLPWASSSAAVENTTFVHCSAGAFNYSKQTGNPPPVFDQHVITLQDVYGTPGFCFVGSILGKLESLPHLSDTEKNAMCLAPKPDPGQANLPLGPSGGDIGVLSRHHGYVQRLSNLHQWIQVPEIREWLVGHRLFNFGHYRADEMDAMVKDMSDVLEI